MTTLAPRDEATRPAPEDDVRKALRLLLDGEHAEMRDRVREWLSRPGDLTATERPLDEYREQVLAWAKELADEGQTAVGFPVEYGGRLSSTRSKAVIRTVNELCGELRDHASTLVEAFGVPEPALGVTR